MKRFTNICTSIAGSVGTGNIFGVAICIAAGGPGAVLWLWVSAIIGMAVKSNEVRLGTRYGGAMGYMGRRAARLFAALIMLSSMTVGGAVQVGAMTEALRPMGAGFLVPLAVPALAFAMSRRRGRALALITPVMAVLYLAGAWYVIFIHRENILPALAEIFRAALTPRAAIAGLTKGMLSHEAGLGTAALAHSDGEGKPIDGAIEVAADTLVVSTATALMLLTTGESTPLAALATAIPMARELLAASILLFAFSSVLSWQSYGEKCAEYLKIDRKAYISAFSVLLAPLSLLPVDLAAALSDPVNIALASVNILAMIKKCRSDR